MFAVIIPKLKYLMRLEFNLDKKYGFMLSGGLDSAVLLALVLKHNPTINLTIFTIPKKDGASKYAKSLSNYFGLNDPILVGDPTVTHNLQGLTAVNEIRSKYKFIDHLFFASNKVPPVSFGQLKPPYRVPSSNTFFIMPFFNMYKNEIIKIAEENNFQHLYNLSHTCTEQYTGRCNICWQCQERAWAFKQANIIDTGIL